jgi:hypothetical protein
VVSLQVLQIVYTVFISIATKYGLGRLFAEVGDPEVYATAVMYEVFSQVAGLMVIGVGSALSVSSSSASCATRYKRGLSGLSLV